MTIALSAGFSVAMRLRYRSDELDARAILGLEAKATGSARDEDSLAGEAPSSER